MSADDRQVGGSHYQSSYQHWDMVLRTGVGYFEGQATKYLARHRKSGKSFQDLQKAQHYVEKLLESAIWYTPGASRRNRFGLEQELRRFCETNKITGKERNIFFLLCSWTTEAELVKARDLITELIVECTAPVPLEDSNKHAERAVPSGANGMKAGDRVVYDLNGWHGIAKEFFQDGDALVLFDGALGAYTVKWSHLEKES